MSKDFSPALVYVLLFMTESFVESRQIAVYPNNDSTTQRQLHLLDITEDKIYLRDHYKIYLLNASNLDVVNNVLVCSPAMCDPNSISLLNDQKGVIMICGTEYSLCSVWDRSDFNFLGTSSDVSVTVSSLSSRPAIGIVTSDGSMFVAVTYGPGIKADRYGGNWSFHETYRFAVSRIKFHNGTLVRDKTLPFRLPQNVQLDEYLVFFKGAFEDAKHVYFVTNQKPKVGKNENFASKLISICKNDPYFYSYTDIVLECKKGDTVYNLIQDINIFKPFANLEKEVNVSTHENDTILAGTFASGSNPDNPEYASAICLYSLKDIKRKVTEARETFIACTGSNLTESEKYLDNNIPGGCLDENMINVTHSAKLTGECEETMPLLSYVISDVILSADAVFEFHSPSDRLTKLSIQTDDAVKAILLYVGTSSGKLLTLNIINASSAHVFDEITVGAGHEIRALHVDKDKTIYAMTDRKLVKYEPFDCDVYKNCEAVVKSYNPLCGWCVYRNRSVPVSGSHCQHAQQPNHLISSGGQCISILLMSAEYEVGKTSQVFFFVRDLPEPIDGDDFYCEFKIKEDFSVFVDAANRGKNSSFTCDTPNILHHSSAVLKLFVSTTSVWYKARHNVTLAQTSIQFYDCKTYKRCGDCTANRQIRCVWHLAEGQCRNNDTGARFTADMKDTSCPYVRRIASKTPFVHVGIATNVSLGIENMYESMDLKCCVNDQCSTAIFVNQTMIICTLKVSTTGSAKLILPLHIMYSDVYIDEKENMTVTVYDCRHLATDCSECSALNTAHFKCNWCKRGSCDYSTTEDCMHVQSCPAPVLTKISPSTAPVGGGTIVTISGHDIGISPESITYIQLAGIPCLLIKKRYVVSKKVVCKAGDASYLTSGNNITGPVHISTGNKSSSGLTFVYKEPVLTGLFPMKGPQAGGTMTTISGSNFDIGNRDITACFVTDDNRTLCEAASVVKSHIHNKEVYHIETTSPPSGSATEFISVEVTFDGDTRRELKSSFTYLPDPVIETVHPMKSIQSGGIKITVFGRRLQNANRTSIKSTSKSQTTVRRCAFQSDKQVICRTPRLRNAEAKLAWKTETACSIHLDGVKKSFNLEYYPDPTVGSTDFVNTSTLLDVTQGHLLIGGRHLTLAAYVSDVRVTIGQSNCHIVHLNSTSIKCLVSKERIPSGSLLPVNVTIGDFHKLVGFVQSLQLNATLTDSSSFLTVVILSSCIGLLGIIVLLVVLRRLKICVRKSKSRMTYLTLNRLGGNDTPILPGSVRRHSNCNIYEVINDLQVPTSSTDETRIKTDSSNAKEDEPPYQCIEDSQETSWKQPEDPIDNVPGDSGSSKPTLKDYYLSPVMLKELKDHINDRTGVRPRH